MYRATGLYALAILPMGVLALALGGWIMDVSRHSAPARPAGFDGWALNLLPPLAAGFLTYLLVARWGDRRDVANGALRSRLRRCAALYVVVLGLGAVLLHDGGSPDFWSLGQLVLWLWVASVGGIAADAVIAFHRRRQGAAG